MSGDTVKNRAADPSNLTGRDQNPVPTFQDPDPEYGF